MTDVRDGSSGASRRRSCWPTADEELLLAAALLPMDEAIAAWNQWRDAIGLEVMHSGSRRLIPLIYRRFQSFGLPEASLGPLRSVYRREWYFNQTLQARGTELLQAFGQAGIETLVLKGTALVARYYHDPAVRPMNDFDILVPERQAIQAIRLMLELGWTSREPAPELLVQSRHAALFTDPLGRPVDFHWHALWECWTPGVDDGFWRRSVRIEVHGVATRALSTPDELLHLCVHGVAWNEVAPIHWIPDAMTVMRSGLTDADWDSLVERTLTLKMTLPVWHGLSYLQRRWDAPVPSLVLARLRQAPVSNVQRLMFRRRTAPPLPIVSYADLIAYRYFLPSGGLDWSRLPAFPRYIQHYVGVEHLWQVPGYIAGWTGTRLAQAWRERER